MPKAGDQLGHYCIVTKIGAGGMGEVYLAEDTRLNRRVAIKFLPVDFAADEDCVRRFEQEAKATSALNHPNILTVYDTGESEGTHFIAAEFIITARHWANTRKKTVKLKIFRRNCNSGRFGVNGSALGRNSSP